MSVHIQTDYDTQKCPFIPEKSIKKCAKAGIISEYRRKYRFFEVFARKKLRVTGFSCYNHKRVCAHIRGYKMKDFRQTVVFT